VAKLSGDRLNSLEQALPLAHHFHDVHEELLTWFDDMEPEVEKEGITAVNPDQLKAQQEKVAVCKMYQLMYQLM
jgi:hypothetical protein